MVKIIKLTQGFEALVDDEDFEYLSQWKWWALEPEKGKYYAAATISINGKSKKVLMHRIIAERMGLSIDGLQIDHKDGDQLNNQRSNLRSATQSQNGWNRSMSKNNRSGYKGVSRDKKKWAAKIYVNGKLFRLGNFSTPEEAAQAYNNAALQHFGEFAWLNEILPT